MHVAKVVRSGTTVSIELPAGFEIGEGDMEVLREGSSFRLRPIDVAVVPADEWAWLDKIVGPLPKDFLDALDEFEGEQPDRVSLD